MEFKFGNQMFFFGRDNVQTVRANNSAVETLNQRCNPVPRDEEDGQQEKGRQAGWGLNWGIYRLKVPL